MTSSAVESLAIADACGSEAAFLTGSLKGAIGIVVECLSLPNAEPGLIIQLGGDLNAKIACGIGDVQLKPELQGFSIVPLTRREPSPEGTTFEFMLNNKKRKTQQTYLNSFDATDSDDEPEQQLEDHEKEEVLVVESDGKSDFKSIETLVAAVEDPSSLVSLNYMIKASTESLNKSDDNEFSGAFRLEAAGLRRAIDLVVTHETLRVAVSSKIPSVISVVSAALLILEIDMLTDDMIMRNEINSKSFSTSTETRLSKIVLQCIIRLTEELSADILWDTDPTACVLLLWCRYCVQHNVLLPSPTIESSPVEFKQSQQPLQESHSPKKSWEPSIPLDTTEGVSCIAGYWKTLKDKTVVKVNGDIARFKVTPSSYGSEWIIANRDGVITLLGCKLNVKTSSTHVLRWEDGDVWERLQNDDDEVATPEAQFGIHSQLGTRRVYTPEPPELPPKRCSMIRPFSAPARTDRFIPETEFKWRFGEYRNTEEIASTESLQDTNLRNSFDELDSSHCGFITRRVFDNYFDSLEHIGVRSSCYVERILAQVSSQHKPGIISYNEFAMIMLRMASR